MKVEYDLKKSNINKVKHGIDFKRAQKLWDGKVVELQAKNKNEKRLLVIGKIKKTYWSAIITKRTDNIRIISVRRARDEEKKLYDES